MGKNQQYGDETNKKIPRGTPYYCRGMSAVAYGNIDRGFRFFSFRQQKMISEKDSSPIRKPREIIALLGYSLHLVTQTLVIWLGHYSSALPIGLAKKYPNIKIATEAPYHWNL